MFAWHRQTVTFALPLLNNATQILWTSLRHPWPERISWDGNWHTPRTCLLIHGWNSMLCNRNGKYAPCLMIDCWCSLSSGKRSEAHEKQRNPLCIGQQEGSRWQRMVYLLYLHNRCVNQPFFFVHRKTLSRTRPVDATRPNGGMDVGACKFNSRSGITRCTHTLWRHGCGSNDTSSSSLRCQQVPSNDEKDTHEEWGCGSTLYIHVHSQHTFADLFRMLLSRIAVNIWWVSLGPLVQTWMREWFLLPVLQAVRMAQIRLAVDSCYVSHQCIYFTSLEYNQGIILLPCHFSSRCISHTSRKSYTGYAKGFGIGCLMIGIMWFFDILETPLVRWQCRLGWMYCIYQSYTLERSIVYSPWEISWQRTKWWSQHQGNNHPCDTSIWTMKTNVDWYRQAS